MCMTYSMVAMAATAVILHSVFVSRRPAVFTAIRPMCALLVIMGFFVVLLLFSLFPVPICRSETSLRRPRVYCVYVHTVYVRLNVHELVVVCMYAHYRHIGGSHSAIIARAFAFASAYHLCRK